MNRVEEILVDALAVAGKKPDASFSRRFAESLPLFLDCHEAWLKDPRFSESTGRWLAFCTAEALKRESPTPQQQADAEQAYCALFQKYADWLEQQVRQQLPPDAPENMDLLISQGFAAWTDNAMKWAHRLQNDLLYPCLRGAIPEDADELVRTEYGTGDLIPQWRESPDILQTQEEYFVRQTGLFLANSLETMLFRLSLAEIKPQIRVNPYWGHCGYGAMGGTGTVWPMCVRLRVKTAENARQGWKRSAER
ncbi:MAG: hypothetical protein JXL80_03220 [Planctomycetes bacterium]|nr:hypothetical protein [Planctomycetota bacterium]